MSIAGTSYETAIAKAANLGLRIEHPQPNQLFIDIDNEESYALFNERIALLFERGSVRIIADRPSKSGLPKRHIIVELDYNLNEMERIALQACLGSDLMRELLSYFGAKSGITQYPTLFFEPA